MDTIPPLIFALICALLGCLLALFVVVLVMMVLVSRLAKSLRRMRRSRAHTNPVFELDRNAGDIILTGSDSLRRHSRPISSLPPWEQGSLESVVMVPSRKTSRADGPQLRPTE